MVQRFFVEGANASRDYREIPLPLGGEDEKLTGDARREAEHREEEARIWISGLEAVKEKIGVKVIYDLSATPFFLRGSGYSEGTLFPWVVSDFSLIDAIESGIVKVPRVPVADDSMIGEQPTYRDLWLRIRDGLPRKGRGTEAVSGEPKLPLQLEGALTSLYANYRKYYERWEANAPPSVSPPDAGGRYRGGAKRRRPLSSFATTPTSARWFSTMSPAGKKNWRTAPVSWCPVSCRSSATRATAAGSRAPTPSSLIPSNWNRARE
jgi:hypothetical protein